MDMSGLAYGALTASGGLIGLAGYLWGRMAARRAQAAGWVVLEGRGALGWEPVARFSSRADAETYAETQGRIDHRAYDVARMSAWVRSVVALQLRFAYWDHLDSLEAASVECAARRAAEAAPPVEIPVTVTVAGREDDTEEMQRLFVAADDIEGIGQRTLTVSASIDAALIKIDAFNEEMRRLEVERLENLKSRSVFFRAADGTLINLSTVA